jgi:hypothetical protein
VPALTDWKLLADWLKRDDRASALFGAAGVTNLARLLRYALCAAIGVQVLEGDGCAAAAAAAAAQEGAMPLLHGECPSLRAR